jgi:hypothetical protein
MGLVAAADRLDQLERENAALRQDKKRLEGVVETFIETINVPEANCSCHISAPCDDCFLYGYTRDVVREARTILDAARAKEGGAL